MLEWGTVPIFFVAVVMFSIFWGRILWYCDEGSKGVTRVVFFLMTFTRRTFPEIKSMLLSIIYYVFGLFGILFFGFSYHVDVMQLFVFKWYYVWLSILGIIAEISLAHFLTNLYLKSMGEKRINPVMEVRNMPWISGILKMPRFFIPIAPALGGMMEEIFFRGVLLLILIRVLSVSSWLSIGFITLVFLIEQWIQLRTSVQRFMIGFGSFSISFIGGLLVLISGSIVPSILSHVSFVIFYFGYSLKSSN